MRSWTFAFAIFGSLTSLLSLQAQPICPPRTPYPCLPNPWVPGTVPPVMPYPSDSRQPGTSPGQTPGQVPTPNPTQPGTQTPDQSQPSTQTPDQSQANTPDQPSLPQDSFAQATERGTEAGATFSPNMFGDLFGGRTMRAVLPRPSIVIPAVPGTPGNTIRVGGFFTDANGARSVFPVDPQAPNFVFLVGNNTTSFGTQITENYVSSGPARADGRIPLLVNQQDQASVLAEAIRQGGPGGTLVYVDLASGADPVTFDTQGNLASANIETQFDYTVPGSSGVPSQIIQQSPVVLLVSSPSAGGNVGRTKLSEDNSPLPRDRVIFNYDYFENVPLTTRKDVNRINLGVEKTLFNNRNSIELRIPFASTLSSDSVADGLTNTSRVEFGNIRLASKHLLIDGCTFDVAAGLGVSLPTADDTRVGLLDGTQLVRIHNDAFILSPYVAALWTPNDRFFNQSWFAVDFGVGGNRVEANPDFLGLRSVGRLHDQPLLQLDTQFGYWLWRSEDANQNMRGLAPFLELHYNTSLSNPETVRAGAFSLGDMGGNINEFNVTLGAVMQLGDNFTLSAGAVLPLSGDKFFDYQFGIRGNWYFGRSRRPSTPPSF